MKKLLFLVFATILVSTFSFAQTVATRRADGTMLINGTPFFPNGIYHVAWYSTQAELVGDMQLIGQSGFNCVHISATDGGTITAAMLDAAQAAGLYVILESPVWGTPKTVHAELVNAFKNHPALIGWNIGDDVHNHSTTTEMQTFHNDVKALDPNHLTFFTVYNSSVWNPYFGVGDYIMPYSYPVGGGDPMCWVDHQMNLALAQNKPMLGIPQAYSWTGNQNAAPTAKQYRNMAYQNLINNVKGILPYCFTESGRTNNYLPAWTNLWNAVKGFNSELKTLDDAILNGTYTRANTGYTPGSCTGVQSAYWIYNNELYITVVSTVETGGNINASITLPSNVNGPAVAVFSGQPSGMTFNNTTKVLSGTVIDGDVHVYKLTIGSAIDTQAPTVPTALTSSSMTQTSFTLSWTASTDNVGVTGYEVFKDGVSVGTTTSTSMSISGLTCNTTYAMTVKARDAVPNWSAASTASNIPTSTCPSTVTITARGEVAGYAKDKAYNNILTDKWADYSKTTWLQFQFSTARVYTSYTLTSAFDLPARDPKTWTLQGSNNGITWTTLSSKSNESFASRGLTKTYTFTNTTAYTYYKLVVTANNGDNGFTQLAEISFGGSGGNLKIQEAALTGTAKSAQIPTGIDNPSVSPINVYPNPASDFVTIDFTNSLNNELSHIKIIDLTGRKVYESSGTAASMKISTVEFLKGVYLISIRKGDEMYNSKLIIN